MDKFFLYFCAVGRDFHQTTSSHFEAFDTREEANGRANLLLHLYAACDAEVEIIQGRSVRA